MLVVKKLLQYTPCDVSDALVKYGVSNGGYIPNLVKQSGPDSTVVGQAYTVLYAAKSDPRPAIKESYIDIIPQGAVLVMALAPELQLPHAPYVRVNNALYGGLMSTRASYRGAAGSVILGRIRDLDEHRELKYPVWSYGVGSTAPGPVVKVVGINVPVEIRVQLMEIDKDFETIKVNAGDYIVADKNGAVVLNQGHPKFHDILEYIPKRVAADTLVSEDIKKGKPAAESQKQRRANL
ncbi:uncharacterized protein KQ657_002906 [Scheffersomyces spartinae]|uniref:4-hydroxy-4-methyl-2-oxoglutarate aldolase n=1 Tax=Scheffersomyces spartinae TaxID=45513 RepID=A0A9P8AH06_9ASCO|nr:uncharacterized protein KQ657_002906 [Scheffersomyces spartinae]KAG7191637.1 hypothetical protein KQ657_002906 [Scheffersomyces spartinae]